MKRYLLFAGHRYYPGGGAEDFCGFFDTIEEAKAAPRYPYRDPSWVDADWAHIADSDDGLRILWYWDSDAFGDAPGWVSGGRRQRECQPYSLLSAPYRVERST